MRRFAAAWLLLGASAAPAAGPTTRPTSQPASQPARTPPSELTVEALGRDFRPLVVRAEGRRLDWPAGVIAAVGSGTATGRGAQEVAMAKRAARVVAARNALLMMKGIATGPCGKFADIRRDRLTVEGVLKDFEQVAETFDAKSLKATATLHVPIHGPDGLVAKRVVVLGMPPRRWQPPRPPKGAERIDALVIDARGVGFTPCLYPQIMTPGRKCLLDGVWLRRDEPTRRNRPLYVTYRPARPEAATRPAKLPETVLFGKSRKRALVVRAVRAPTRPATMLTLDAGGVEALSRRSGVFEVLELGEVAVVCDPAPIKPPVGGEPETRKP